VITFNLPKGAARFIVLQRIELINPFLVKLRKLFGRYIFSNFITKCFLNSKSIAKKYYDVMLKEFSTIKKFIKNDDKFFLSIGSGIGGLELIINQNFKNNHYYFIERNYVSKKVRYGWGGMDNEEAYNDLNLQKTFLKMNEMNGNQINIFDYDNENLPDKKFDVIISLLSLDYHYDFYIYSEYLKKVSKVNTKIIFDTIRAEHFKKIFKNVEIIRSDTNTVHKSKRIICSQFLS
tara:strand:- start:123 stop:824 length:702 start_codon:yes stop_codon:yes gene_type:complete